MIPPSLIKRLFPHLDDLQGRRLISARGDLTGFFVVLPLALGGLAWLVRLTSLAQLSAQTLHLLVLAGLMLVFSRTSFYMVSENRAGMYSDFSSALDSFILWIGCLIIGPMALWVGLLLLSGQFLERLLRERNRRIKSIRALCWNHARNYIFNFSEYALCYLVGLHIYQALVGGSVYPLPGFDWQGMIAALLATLVNAILKLSLWLSYIAYMGVQMGYLQDKNGGLQMMWSIASSILLFPLLVDPFAILAAGIYTTSGIVALGFFLVGVFLVSLLTRRFSQAAERSRQQNRQLELLEKISRSLLNTPADDDRLDQILQEHIPSMFTYGRLEVRLFPERVLVRYPPDVPPVETEVWHWAEKNDRPLVLPAGSLAPWNDQALPYPCLVAPILVDVHAGTGLASTPGGTTPGTEVGAGLESTPDGPIPIRPAPTEIRLAGAVYVDWLPAGQPLYVRFFADSLPAAQALADHIASALHRAQAYAESLAHQRVLQELALAGQIQASLLPEHLPQVPGYQVSACLLPARQTSGDFYDFIELPGGALGVVIADVADKGLGAALYMTLVRTLLRTYAIAEPGSPARALRAVNQRLLQDSRSDQVNFVTVFYAILQPHSGELIYCNAGHPPPLVAHRSPSPVEEDNASALCEAGREDPPLPQGEGPGVRVDSLPRSGMALGVSEQGEWHDEIITLSPGDRLALYTDGVSETQNMQGDLYGSQRLVTLLQEAAYEPVSASLPELQARLLDDLRTFSGENQPADDVTLVVVERDL